MTRDFPLWLHDDPSRPLNAPLTNTPDKRSPMALKEVVAQFDVESAPRYRVRDITGDGKKETFCNIYVSDVTRALFAEIPHEWEGKYLNVRAMAAWLRKGLGAWRREESWRAQFAADSGRPAVALYDPPPTVAHGHIAVLVPCDGDPGVWVSQAGARNYARCPLPVGFGTDAVEFWVHQ